jgi:signal transduction histidine kinase
MDKPPRRFLWSAHLARAVTEAWVWGFTILFLLWRLAGSVIPSVMGNGWFVLAGTAGMWAVLRTRIPTGAWWQQILKELGSGFVLGLGMVAGIIGPVYLLHWEAAWQAAFAESFPSIVLMLGVGPGFVIARGAVHLWRYWTRLRRRRMLWALTHAHLVVVLIVIGLWAVVLLILSPLGEILSYDPQFDSFWTALVSDLLVTFFPAAMAVLFITAFVLAVVLPPSALLSFLVARKTTRRLEYLAQATGALRGGDYATRVAVSGEDEVAQLQSDFNAMAEALETSLHDLEAERDKVAQLLHARQALVAGVSHELRTPVATMRGYLESTQTRDAAPETLAHGLAVMETEVLRLQRMLDDLFTLSRVEVEALTLDLRPVTLEAVVQRRIAALAPLAWERECVEMVAEIPAGLPPVYADAGRLDQILTNLLRNARRHTPPGGIIVVRAEAQADRVRLDVCDTGEGIAPEELVHIWERFYRGEGARAQDQYGAGLGLTLVKELAEAMGGAVDVQSVVGEGSCFTVWLPRGDCDKVETIGG